MVFDYCVKHDGIYYEAGTDVPMNNKGVEKSTPTVKETVTEETEPKRGRKKKDEE